MIRRRAKAKRGKERERILPPPPPVLATIQRGEEVDGSAERINSIFYAFGSIPGSVAFARKSRYTSVYVHVYIFLYMRDAIVYL